MAKATPTIQVTAPGVYLNDEEFDWSAMSLIPSSPKVGDRKRKSLTYLASPKKSHALEEDLDYYVGDRAEQVSESEDDPKVEQRTLDYLKQTRRSPLKPVKSISDVEASSPSKSNTLQLHNDQNLMHNGLSSPRKRNAGNWDEEFKSPAKLVVGENQERLPVNKETDRLRFSTSPTPQFPTRAEPVRSPRTAVRRLSAAFGRSEVY